MRYGFVVPLSDFMVGEGRDVTLPTLDVDDFMGKSFTTGPDGKLYQLPDQQFANLYWFRYDWFTRPDLQEKFRKIYGYELGVPVNWSAYEDIAEFFTVYVREIDGQRIYGHNDYGKESPDLGWRFTDAWLSMAGAGDKGLPNGKPVDEWGIRVEGCNPAGASVSRGGAANGPGGTICAPQVHGMAHQIRASRRVCDGFLHVPALSGQRQCRPADILVYVIPARHGRTGTDGQRRWRTEMAHGAVPAWGLLEEGMKMGYQDCGSWTLMKNTPIDRRKAAWLFAQFTVSKTVSLKKAHVGLTPIRDSDIRHQSFTERAPKLGGLVEF